MNRCMMKVMVLQNSVISFSPGQTAAYLDCRSKGHSLPWYTIDDIFMWKKSYINVKTNFQDTLSSGSLPNIVMKEGENTTQHSPMNQLLCQWTNKTKNDDRYPWLERDDMRSLWQIEKGWKVTLKDSRSMKEQKAKVNDLIKEHHAVLAYEIK